MDAHLAERKYIASQYRSGAKSRKRLFVRCSKYRTPKKLVWDHRKQRKVKFMKDNKEIRHVWVYPTPITKFDVILARVALAVAYIGIGAIVLFGILLFLIF